MPAPCGICQDGESKYKCPVCTLPYCSIACYKTHKPTHADAEATRNDTQIRAKRDRPGTKQRVPKADFTGFENDAEFKRLLCRYPLLKVQLQSVYGLTLEPAPEEARSWYRRPLPGDPAPPPQRGRGRGGRRGDRGSRGGRGRGRGGFEPPVDYGRQGGQWTVEKGEKEALSMMKKWRKSSGGEGDMAEGLKEFAELCMMRFGPDRAQDEASHG